MIRLVRNRVVRAAFGVAVSTLVVASAAVSPAQAANYVPVSGGGSTWSQNAIDQWRRDVYQFGLQVNYAGNGSSDGRNQFRAGTVDFAVSEIPYGTRDAGVYDPPPTDSPTNPRPFAYLPIVAGGTSFMYNLKIGGRPVTDLQLSQDTIAKMFTNQIKRWNDPAIAKDNPGLRLPALPIVPVVRSDGSGTTAQFSLWLATKYPSLWNSYCAKAGRPANPCGQTSTYPTIAGSGFVSQAGSLGVAGYVAQSNNVGTINYVEYSYALNSGFPVARMANKAGYFIEPTADSVAVALQGATINKDLTQNLKGVYDNVDPRAYPLSSYSYMIIPISSAPPMTPAKGRSLAAFAKYFLCDGQQKAPLLGYSPLPLNLVQAGFTQIRKIPGADLGSINVKQCNNPTFSTSGVNLLAKNAPQPLPCQKMGIPTQCSSGTAGAARISTAVYGLGNSYGMQSGGGSNGGTTPVPGGSPAPGTSPGPGQPSTGPTTGPQPSTGPTGPTVTPTQGGVVPSTGPQDPNSGNGQTQLVAEPVSVPSSFAGGNSVLIPLLALLVLLAVVVAPVAVTSILRGRK